MAYRTHRWRLSLIALTSYLRASSLCRTYRCTELSSTSAAAVSYTLSQFHHGVLVAVFSVGSQIRLT